jgi:hypothetical protein
MRSISQIAVILDGLLQGADPFSFLAQGLAISASGWSDPELNYHQETILLNPTVLAKKILAINSATTNSMNL